MSLREGRVLMQQVSFIQLDLCWLAGSHQHRAAPSIPSYQCIFATPYHQSGCTWQKVKPRNKSSFPERLANEVIRVMLCSFEGTCDTLVAVGRQVASHVDLRRERMFRKR